MDQLMDSLMDVHMNEHMSEPTGAEATPFEPAYDPYDVWMTPAGVTVRTAFYAGKLRGKLGAAIIAGCDWLMPGLFRLALGAQRRHYPITVAQAICCQPQLTEPRAALNLLVSIAAINDDNEISWGLGFPWMSKNGLYGPEVPFVTHTPYAMEALLHLAKFPEVAAEAHALFLKTRTFLDRLIIMHDDPETLALSYAPVVEPRMVVNANAYAAFAYALHHAHGDPAAGHDRTATRLAEWVVRQQHGDGSWHYYADDEPGNFIDGFHTGFVLKNLRKAMRLIPDLASLCEPAIRSGGAFLESGFYDQRTGLMRRFTERDIKDPWAFDLYDQAEYLGYLLDEGRVDDAVAFDRVVEGQFRRGDSWYCKRDVFGRRWGRDFLRWGIMPYLHNRHGLPQPRTTP